ncbi:beta-propeller fold lactonase family protein [Streptomyces sp. NPDC020489]|uniref:beta-propeller fold lactonase family protein n=1 Tax=Streptomyces sp. NPDC020489 TaxID=3365077 RepID=UPI0037AEB941
MGQGRPGAGTRSALIGKPLDHPVVPLRRPWQPRPGQRLRHQPLHRTPHPTRQPAEQRHEPRPPRPARDNQCLPVANYATSTLAVLPCGADGRLRPADQAIELTGTPDPHRTQQTDPHPPPHPLSPRPTPRPCSDRHRPATLATTTVRSGAGPGHIAYHPHLRLAYVADELNSQITTYICRG